MRWRKGAQQQGPNEEESQLPVLQNESRAISPQGSNLSSAGIESEITNKCHADSASTDNALRVRVQFASEHVQDVTASSNACDQSDMMGIRVTPGMGPVPTSIMETMSRMMNDGSSLEESYLAIRDNHSQSLDETNNCIHLKDNGQQQQQQQQQQQLQEMHESLLQSEPHLQNNPDGDDIVHDNVNTASLPMMPTSGTPPLQTNHDDDLGQDHAVPDDIIDDPYANIPWSPQNVQSTCEFTHTIENYSSKRESGCKKAEYSNITIDNFGNRWRLIVYVNGNGRASNHHLSLFLQVADADDLPFGWKKAVSYVLTLEHPHDANLGYAKRNPDKTFKLCPKAIDWGWSQFITSDRIQQDGFVRNDSLTVRAHVTVKSSSISIDSEDAELYLKCAVEEGNADAVEVCLAQGASVNCQFKDDLYTPLHTACSSSASERTLEVLNLLLRHGADGNACNKWRETPLLIAANNGHLAAVDSLLESGADPSMCSEAGWSALTFAAHKGYDDIVGLLLKAGAPVNCRVIEDLSTPLHKACAGNKDGHLSAVKQLLSGGADVHALNKWRETPLLTAANHGQAATVKALLDAGADPCRCTDTGWSPLSIAAYKGHDEVVELLLDHGAPTEEEDPTLSALLQAATKGLPNTVQLLLRHGADHTVTTKKGDTALSILVEQNLIDTAVEMVTEYKASIPRCSRDRKKVQRARLLINLRIKQQREEGKYTNYNDDSDQDDLDNMSRTPLHDNGDSATFSDSNSSLSKKKKKEKKSMTAEEKAKAAAEALLLELEQEDAKAQQEEAAATSKRNKKKKKKERERQQKLEQEKLRREQEEKEAEERRMKEEEEKKAREAKAKELREREMKEAIERQKKAAARQKEKEEKERKRREEERRLQEKREKQKAAEEKRSKDISTRNRHENQKRAAQIKMSQKDNNQRIYESKDTKMASAKHNKVDNRKEVNTSFNGDSPMSTSTLSKGCSSATKSPSSGNQFENLASSVGIKDLHRSAVNVSDSQKQASICTEGGLSGIEYITAFPHVVEPVTVPLLRHEKVAELLRKFSTDYNVSTSIDVGVIRSIIYKWIVRASYDSMPYLDPVIPSWTDKSTLITFMQRQMISESRRVSHGTNMEVLKETGSFLADLCESLAGEVVDYRNSCMESLRNDISDIALNITAGETINSSGQCNVIIDWNGRSKVCVPADTFQKLRNRYTGPVQSFLGSVFGLMKRYETLNMILSETNLNCRIPTSALSVLGAELKVSLELWTAPLSVFSVNNFCGVFPDVDALFGGFRPFVEQNNPVEILLTQKGGSVAVLPSCDSTTASFFIGRILNILEAVEGKRVPLSFVVFLPSHSFRDLATTPSVDDLELLDPRLMHSHRSFIRSVELLHAGQHYFQEQSNDKVQLCGSGSLLLILQNELGRLNFPVKDNSIMNILFSMSINDVMPNSDQYQTFPLENVTASVSSSPLSQHQNPPANFEVKDFGASRSNNNSSRRGRFFELVDDGEDDFLNADEMVSGMLSSLDISIFQDNNASQDVDIEAISLMGIGNHRDATSRHGTGRFR
eukprot:CAMPEP_0176498276 /NCGR_PEP_ID=MMETSP0200_2-20121128/12225_1 /TAXON_ID=947934 /ORGANISM="Chaetoceros sp., Strain GSL56" /LENGTH=1545 /DNA_ID=CAMNT_0017896453 /DNA_START=217 /DNA_END=4854 /DNA_ORIENTATION=+